MKPSLRIRLEGLVTRLAELDHLLAAPETMADIERFRAYAKEHAEIGPVVERFRAWKNAEGDLAAADELAADPSMRAYAEEEKRAARERMEALARDLQAALLPKDANDTRNVFLEVRAGTGGDEAAIFAGDLYDMYTRYARTKGWTVEEISFSPGEAGGFKEVVFGVKGDDVYTFLRYESGGHRVQRVPKTETQGRIHTSAATVAVLPEPDEVQVNIAPADIEWERMRAGGAGGQHVNKTESAVRIWYRKGTPDEMEVKCQDERSQTKNYERAMRILRSRLFDRQQERLHQARADARKSQIGTGDRNSRIRTYNYPQNRCTDHRIEFTAYKLDAIMAGDLDQMVTPMREAAKKEKLAGLV